MKRSPMKRGTTELKRTPFKPKEKRHDLPKTDDDADPVRPLQAVVRVLVHDLPGLRRATLNRAAKPMRARSKTNARRESGGEDKLCRGQPCYLLIPGIARHDASTVVPCHSNQLIHGKGKGIKALDVYTVPGCALCHRELDQGARFTKAEKFALWDDAYARWECDRALLLVKK